MTQGHGASPASGHLGEQVSAYVDRRLPADLLLAYDRHLGVCIACRAHAHDERRLLDSLRGAPVPPAPPSLGASLRMLGMTPAAHPGPRPLPVLTATSPPMHRSAVRAVMLAGLTASAGAAVAVSLLVAGPAPTGPGAASGGGTPSGAPAATTSGRSGSGVVQGQAVSRLLTLGTTRDRTVPQARMVRVAGLRAQSTP